MEYVRRGQSCCPGPIGIGALMSFLNIDLEKRWNLMPSRLQVTSWFSWGLWTLLFWIWVEPLEQGAAFSTMMATYVQPWFQKQIREGVGKEVATAACFNCACHLRGLASCCTWHCNSSRGSRSPSTKRWAVDGRGYIIGVYSPSAVLHVYLG